MRAAFVTAIAVCLAACGGGNDSQTGSTPEMAALIPVAPAPGASPTPTPEPPSEDPFPAIPGPGRGGGDQSGGACGAPVPPPLSRINVKIYNSSGGRTTLDSTPLVKGAAYCREIGFTDGRSYCPVRPDGSPERLACEALRLGSASDTGRIGPTWSAGGAPCTGAKPTGASCVNHGSNQFFVFAYGPGRYQACGGGVCGSLDLE